MTASSEDTPSITPMVPPASSEAPPYFTPIVPPASSETPPPASSEDPPPFTPTVPPASTASASFRLITDKLLLPWLEETPVGAPQLPLVFNVSCVPLATSQTRCVRDMNWLSPCLPYLSRFPDLPNPACCEGFGSVIIHQATTQVPCLCHLLRKQWLYGAKIDDARVIGLTIFCEGHESLDTMLLYVYLCKGISPYEDDRLTSGAIPAEAMVNTTYPRSSPNLRRCMYWKVAIEECSDYIEGFSEVPTVYSNCCNAFTSALQTESWDGRCVTDVLSAANLTKFPFTVPVSRRVCSQYFGCAADVATKKGNLPVFICTVHFWL